MAVAESNVVENVACMACGCLCDDLRITVNAGQIVHMDRACEIAEPWLLAQNREPEPVAEIDGRAASLDDAIAASAEILHSADYPLIYGLAQSTTAGQRAAVALAECLRGVIDTTASLCHAPSVMAQQQVGKVTCTLGEVRNRADLVIFWGSDPVRTHPRHWERYSVFPRSRFVPRGRENRFVVVADTERTATADAADLFLPIQPGRHFEALCALRAMVRKADLAGHENLGAPTPLLEELAEQIRSSRWCAFFFGVGLAQGDAGHCNVEALLLLAADLNEQRRCVAMRMRVQGNVVGADSVMAWQTGYPFAVNMARGYPRYNPGEYSVSGVLQRQEADACLLIGSETLGWLPPAALEHLRQIPTVILDPASREAPIAAKVRFRIATAGVHESGTAYRMDGVPIPLRTVLPAHYPSDARILAAMQAQIAGADREITVKRNVAEYV